MAKGGAPGGIKKRYSYSDLKDSDYEDDGNGDIDMDHEFDNDFNEFNNFNDYDNEFDQDFENEFGNYQEEHDPEYDYEFEQEFERGYGREGGEFRRQGARGNQFGAENDFLAGLNEEDYDLQIDQGLDDAVVDEDVDDDSKQVGGNEEDMFEGEYRDRRMQPNRQIRANKGYAVNQGHSAGQGYGTSGLTTTEEALAKLRGLKLGSAHNGHNIIGEDSDDDSDDPVARALDQADDEDLNSEDDNNFGGGSGSNYNGSGEETMDEYRDRIFGQLQREIEKRSSSNKK